MLVADVVFEVFIQLIPLSLVDSALRLNLLLQTLDLSHQLFIIRDASLGWFWFWRYDGISTVELIIIGMRSLKLLGHFKHFRVAWNMLSIFSEYTCCIEYIKCIVYSPPHIFLPLLKNLGWLMISFGCTACQPFVWRVFWHVFISVIFIGILKPWKVISILLALSQLLY